MREADDKDELKEPSSSPSSNSLSLPRCRRTRCRGRWPAAAAAAERCRGEPGGGGGGVALPSLFRWMTWDGCVKAKCSRPFRVRVCKHRQHKVHTYIHTDVPAPPEPLQHLPIVRPHRPRPRLLPPCRGLPFRVHVPPTIPAAGIRPSRPLGLGDVEWRGGAARRGGGGSEPSSDGRAGGRAGTPHLAELFLCVFVRMYVTLVIWFGRSCCDYQR